MNKNGVKSITAFVVYRYAYIQELSSRGVKFKITQVSNVISNSWKQEPKVVREEYKKLADDANNLYCSKYQKKQQLQLPINQSSPADGTKSLLTRLNNPSSSTSATDQEELCNPLDTYKNNLIPFDENLIDKQTTFRGHKTKCTVACNHCKKRKVKCEYSDNGSCKLCVNLGYECLFEQQQKRGPKPGKKVKSNSPWEDFQNLSNKYIQEARELDFNVNRIITLPSNSSTPNDTLQSSLQSSEIYLRHLTYLGSTSIMEELDQTYSPEFSGFTTTFPSSINYERRD
ncbi:32313_t:CDS:1 [Racocetra persica]|uniref:32313_t:CDS:1 n=1 Tax=Racocetra persica TaxID=160502 RepID=A0ACA9QLT0_9GLOM|nr:32313_t:CDS:1 [Racocetra persica]